MAEFQDVMRCAGRMCASRKFCNGCKYESIGGGCMGLSFLFDVNRAKKFEADIMDWAKKHPEPIYPTWKEWHEKNFPEATDKFCPRCFMPLAKIGCQSPPNCEACRNSRIPAEVARKLGVEPTYGG